MEEMEAACSSSSSSSSCCSSSCSIAHRLIICDLLLTFVKIRECNQIFEILVFTHPQ